MELNLLPQRARRGISLTALIDVVFILLLFFMLTSTFDQRRALALQMPTIGEAGSNTDAPNFVILHSDGRVARGDPANPAAQLAEAGSLPQLVATLDLELATVLIPEAAASMQQIVTTLEQLKAAGLPRVALGEVLPAAAGGALP